MWRACPLKMLILSSKQKLTAGTNRRAGIRVSRGKRWQAGAWEKGGWGGRWTGRESGEAIKNGGVASDNARSEFTVNQKPGRQ